MKINLILNLALIFLAASISVSFAAGLSEEHSFDTSAIMIKSVVKKGESAVNPISIFSDEKQTFNIVPSSEKDFISIENYDFLVSEQKGTFNAVLKSEGLSEGVYAGKLRISGEEDSIDIPVVLEVESPVLNFDLSSEIAPKFLEISWGEYLAANIIVYNLGFKSGKVFLYYAIKDLNGDVIISEEQELSINNKIQFTKNFLIPKEIPAGDYLFLASINEANSGYVGTSSSLFSISDDILTSPEKDNSKYLGFAFFIIFILIMAFLIINYYWNKKLISNSKEWNKKLAGNSKEWNKKLAYVKRIKFGNIGKEIRKLEHEKELLNEAHNKGYIRKKSFDEGKIKINELVNKLKKRL